MSAKDFKDDLTLLQREPALVSGVVVSVIGLLSALGLQVDHNTSSAIVAVILAVLTLAGALVARSKVTPTAVAQKQLDRGASETTVPTPPAVEEPSGTVAAQDASPVVTDDYDHQEPILAPAPFTSPEVTQDASSVVDSNQEDNKSSVDETALEKAYRLLNEANSTLKADAVHKAAQELEAVKASADDSASDYAAKVAEAEQKLSDAKSGK